MATIEISGALAGWFAGLAKQTGSNLGAACEEALWFYRKRYKDLGLPDPVAAAPESDVDTRSDEEQAAAVLDLVRRLGDRLEFVGVKHLYNVAMANARIGSCLADRQDLVSRMIDDGRLVTYKVENKRAGGADVTAVELPELMAEAEDQRG